MWRSRRASISSPSPCLNSHICAVVVQGRAACSLSDCLVITYDSSVVQLTGDKPREMRSIPVYDTGMDTVTAIDARPRRSKRGRHPDKALSAVLRAAGTARRRTACSSTSEGTRSFQRLVIRGMRDGTRECRARLFGRSPQAGSWSATPLLTSAESRAFPPLPMQPGA